MYSIEYYNNDLIITSYNLQRIDSGNIEKLRKLILQAMKQPCKRILLNFTEVTDIDKRSLNILKISFDIAKNLGIAIFFINLSKECQALINRAGYQKVFQLAPFDEVIKN
jgi:anti-anti-sigma regulatory factor